ncbi:hypothetical protein VB779_03145 [Haloarculaceae archaeon H-GB11]|nr:hypothetical protein [Haloarculaceae archaeon H-GB11]
MVASGEFDGHDGPPRVVGLDAERAVVLGHEAFDRVEPESGVISEVVALVVREYLSLDGLGNAGTVVRDRHDDGFGADDVDADRR